MAPEEPDTPTAQDDAPITRGTWIALAAILAAGLALRLGYLWFLVRRPGFSWVDPDGFLALGVDMARGGWHWTNEAVRFYQFVKAPLYPVLLSFLALAPGYPLSAAVVQGMLNGIAGSGAMFVIGRALHTPRAGLIAAGAYAVLGHSITGNAIFMQENVVIPLTLVAFAVLLHAVAHDGRSRAFAVAGVLFGVAALVRSMPLYFLPVAAAAHVAMAGRRDRALRQASALLAAFAVTILPYCLFISLQEDRLVLIDNQGARYIVLRYSDHPDTDLPGAVESARMLGTALATQPATFVSDRWDVTRGFFMLSGGRWMQTDAPVAATRAGETVTRILVHVTMDLPVALTLLLGPFGYVLARNRRVSALLALWVIANFALMTVFLWGSPRYRASLEAQLMVAAAVVVAGGWRRASPWGLGLAAVASGLLAVIVVPSVPPALGGRGEYGTSPWTETATARVTRVRGNAGFNVQPRRRLIGLTIRAEHPAMVEIRADGSLIRVARVAPEQPVEVRYAVATRQFDYLELRASDPATGQQATVSVELPLPRRRPGASRTY